MNEVERIVVMVGGPWLLLACTVWAWQSWKRPLRKRSGADLYYFTHTMVGGLSSPAGVHARVRNSPVTAVTAFFAFLGGVLQAYGVHVNAAIYGAYGVAAVVWLVLWLPVTLFNRPRSAVPPAVRSWPGMIEFKRRHRAAEPEFKDPRAVPPPPRKKAGRIQF